MSNVSSRLKSLKGLFWRFKHTSSRKITSKDSQVGKELPIIKELKEKKKKEEVSVESNLSLKGSSRTRRGEREGTRAERRRAWRDSWNKFRK